MKKFALTALIAVMCTAIVGSAAFAFAEESSSAKFADALGNGRVTATVNESGETKLKLTTDTDYSLTRAYYTENVNVNDFSMTFTLDAFNEDGAMRVSFLRSKDDFPMNPYGDGFGVYFWDETAWGNTVYTSLRSDFCTYKRSGSAAGNDAKRVCSGENYIGQTFVLKVWDYDTDNLAISVTRNGAENPQAIGTYAKANLPEGFDRTDCVLMITPDIDSRAHSYDNDIEITVKEVKGVVQTAETFTVTATAGEHGSVSATKTGEVKSGAEVIFTVSPDEGYMVDKATVNGEEVTLTEDNKYTLTVAGDAIFNVTFKEIPADYLTVTATAGEHGSVSVSPSTSVVAGTEVTFTVKPDVTYKIDETKLNGIPVAINGNTYTVQVNENVNFEASFVKYSLGESEKFAYGIWDDLKNRADVSVTDSGEKILLAVEDGDVSHSRLYSAEKMSLSSFEMKFTLDSLSTDGGFRISFLATNDDYPMEGYGEGFAVYFWDETAWGYPAGTALRSDLYTYFRSPAERNLISENPNRGAEYICNEFALTVAYTEDKSSIVITLKNNGEVSFEETMPLTVLPENFSVENCYMLFSPEVDGSRAHSRELPVGLTVKSLTYAAANDDTPDKPPVEEEKFSISFVVGDSVVKTMYAEKGDTFFEYIPQDVEGFDGWYTDKEFKNKFDFGTEATEDVVVYAKITKTENSASGCNSSVGAGLPLVAVLAAGAVLLIKKKEKDA